MSVFIDNIVKKSKGILKNKKLLKLISEVLGHMINKQIATIFLNINSEQLDNGIITSIYTVIRNHEALVINVTQYAQDQYIEHYRKLLEKLKKH